MIDVRGVLEGLAQERPVFHSEGDFQHSLAWAIHVAHPAAGLRLEYPLTMGGSESLDVVALLGGDRLVMELKYWTRKLRCEVDGETFHLKDQGAQDISRYDAVKDIGRLERVARGKALTQAYAVWLTNDSAYWSAPRRTDTNDAQFRVHEGAGLSGRRSWGPNTGAGTKKNREIALEFEGSYAVHWADFSRVSSESYGTLRYALVEVTGPMGE